jgi:hypothetical protein
LNPSRLPQGRTGFMSRLPAIWIFSSLSRI